MPKAVPNIVAPDPISHVASWLTPASADVTDKPTTTPLEDPVIALVADARRLEELWGAAYEKKHDREANAIDKQMGAILNQLRNRNIKPVTIAGAIAMLDLGLRCFPDISFRFAETDEPLVDAAIAGLRDMQPGGIADLAGKPRKCMDSAEDWAAIEFKAEDDPGIWEQFDGPAWEEESYHLGVKLRLAAVTLGITKPQMVEQVKELLEKEGGGIPFSKWSIAFGAPRSAARR
jgi:hypothetical protein